MRDEGLGMRALIAFMRDSCSPHTLILANIAILNDFQDFFNHKGAEGAKSRLEIPRF
jgi:hypothetical protein